MAYLGILIPILALMIPIVAIVSKSAIGDAIADSIRHKSTLRRGGVPDPDLEQLHAEVDQLRADLEQMNAQLLEVHERLDFAERLLARPDGADRVTG